MRAVTITAAADGSSLGNPGPTGWAWYIDDDHWASGGWAQGTNNMGELKAVLDLLQQTADRDEPLRVLCDSQYTINALTKWRAGWKRRGWRRADGKPVQNVDLMKALDEALQDRTVTFEWVRGHAGHSLNEAADLRARAAATAFRRGRRPDPGPGLGEEPAGRGAEDDAWADDGEADTDLGQPDLFADVTSPALDVPATDQVVRLEGHLHAAPVAENASDLAAWLHAGWFRVDADGSVRSRADLMSGVLTPDACSIDVIEARVLPSSDVVLLCRGLTDAGSTIRTSLWTREDGQWRQRFEQVTAEGTQP